MVEAPNSPLQTSDDDWLRVDGVLAYVMADKPANEREHVAKARAAGGALPEATIAMMCERAGIEVRWGGGEKLVDAHAFVPVWVAPFYESTVVRSANQTRVLMRASTDPEWRAAGLSVWRLGGLDALVSWLMGQRLR